MSRQDPFYLKQKKNNFGSLSLLWKVWTNTAVPRHEFRLWIVPSLLHLLPSAWKLNSNANPLMLLAGGVDTPIHTRFHLLAFDVAPTRPVWPLPCTLLMATGPWCRQASLFLTKRNCRFGISCRIGYLQVANFFTVTMFAALTQLSGKSWFAVASVVTNY